MRRWWRGVTRELRRKVALSIAERVADLVDDGLRPLQALERALEEFVEGPR